MSYKHKGILSIIVPQDGIVHVESDKGEPFALKARFRENVLGLPFEGMSIEFNSDRHGAVTSYMITHPLFGSLTNSSHGPQ